MNNIVKMTSMEFRKKNKKVTDYLIEGKVIAITFGKKKEIIGYYFGSNQHKNNNI